MAPRATTQRRRDEEWAAVHDAGRRPSEGLAGLCVAAQRPYRAVLRLRGAGCTIGLVAWLALASFGCGGSSFIEAGEQSRPAVGRVRASDALDLETVAWPPPLLSAQPPDLLTGAAIPLVVQSHEERRGLHRLTLLPEAGEPILLEYRLGVGALASTAGERLPVEPGEELLWRLPLDDRLEPTGLLVRERDGSLRALVVIGETLGPLGDELGPPDLPMGGRPQQMTETPMGPSAVSLGPAPTSAAGSGASPGAPPASAPTPGGPSLPHPPGQLGHFGISPDFSAAALVYSETTAVMSCLIAVDHHALKVSDGRDTVRVRPGTSRLIELGDLRGRPRVKLSAEASNTGGPEGATATFELLVFDVSRPQSDPEDPRCPRKSHVSWALLRAATP